MVTLCSIDLIRKFARNIRKDEGVDFTEGEVFARMVVGTSALRLAMDFDKKDARKV